MRVEFRPSIAADFVELQGELPEYRCLCTTAIAAGAVIGIGGLVFRPEGELWASVLMSDEARRYPVAIHRSGLRAIAEFKRLGLKRVFALAQPDNPAAERWLERLGFVAEQLAGHVVFVWNGE